MTQLLVSQGSKAAGSDKQQLVTAGSSRSSSSSKENGFKVPPAVVLEDEVDKVLAKQASWDIKIYPMI